MEEKEKEITTQEITNGGGVFLKGLLVGGILGVVAGILLAPKPGKELRTDIKEKGETAIKDAKRIYEDSRTRAKAALEAAKQRAEEIKDKVVKEAGEDSTA